MDTAGGIQTADVLANPYVWIKSISKCMLLLQRANGQMYMLRAFTFFMPIIADRLCG